MESESSLSNAKSGFEKLSVDLQGEKITVDLANKLKEGFFVQTYLFLILDLIGVKKLEAQNLLPSKLLDGLKGLTILLSGIEPHILSEGGLFESAPKKVDDVSIGFNSIKFDDKTDEFLEDIIKTLKNATNFGLEITNAVQIGRLRVHTVLFRSFSHLERVKLLNLDISYTEVDGRWLGIALNYLTGLEDLILKSEHNKTTDDSLQSLFRAFKVFRLTSVSLLLKGNRVTSKTLKAIKTEADKARNRKNLKLESMQMELDYENIAEETAIATICSDFPPELHVLCIVGEDSVMIKAEQISSKESPTSTDKPVDTTNSTADTKMSQDKSFIDRDDTINYLKGTLKINKAIILGLQAAAAAAEEEEEGPLQEGEDQIQTEEDGSQTEEGQNLSIRSTQSSEEFKQEKWPFNEYITKQQDLNLSVQENEGEVNQEIQVLNQTVDSPSNEERKRIFEQIQGLSSNKESLESKGLNSFGQTFNPANSPRHQCGEPT